jgi:outer membrane protein
MKSRFFVLLFLSLFFLATPVTAAQSKLAYVDLQEALNNSQAGKDAKVQISQKAKEYESEFVQKRKELKDLGENLKKQMALLSPDAKREKEREYQQKVTEFQRATKDAQDNLKQQDADHTREIVKALVKVVEKIGKKDGYTLVFEKGEGSILYADKKIDITDQVIKAYDKDFKSGK